MNQHTRKVLSIFLFLLSLIHIGLSIFLISKIIDVDDGFIIGWVLFIMGIILSLLTYKFKEFSTYEQISDIQNIQSEVNLGIPDVIAN